MTAAPPRCRQCAAALPNRRHVVCEACKRHCACGSVLVAKTKGDECRPCILRRASAAAVCACGRAKMKPAVVCHACYKASLVRARNLANPRLVAAWDRDAFSAEMERLGWTMQALADVAGVSISTIWVWLHSDTWPDRATFDRVCAAMGFDLCQGCEGLGRVPSGVSAELLIQEWRSTQRRRVG